jgi:cell wall assembly regulator SMI1
VAWRRLKEVCEKKGVRPEESVAHRSWLPVATTSEFDIYFVNVDPAFPRVYGSVRRMVSNCFADEHPACASIAELLAQAAAYIDRRERVRKRLAAEHPDQAADQIEVSFRDDDDDEGHD